MVEGEKKSVIENVRATRESSTAGTYQEIRQIRLRAGVGGRQRRGRDGIHVIAFMGRGDGGDLHSNLCAKRSKTLGEPRISTGRRSGRKGMRGTCSVAEGMEVRSGWAGHCVYGAAAASAAAAAQAGASDDCTLARVRREAGPCWLPLTLRERRPHQLLAKPRDSRIDRVG